MRRRIEVEITGDVDDMQTLKIGQATDEPRAGIEVALGETAELPAELDDHENTDRRREETP